MSVEFEQLFCGMVEGPPAYFFRDAARGRVPLASVLGVGVSRSAYLRMPVGAFLVRHPERGPLLVDAGFHPDAARDPVREFGRLGARIFAGLETSAELSVPAQLRERGIGVGDIEWVVMTHLHHDHASGLRQFPGARVVCAAAEWEAATGRLASLGGYSGDHLPEPDRVKQIEFGGYADGVFHQVVDLFEDGTVKLVSTPGHTAGHISVLLATEPEPTLIVGDAVYTLGALDGPRPPFRNANEGAWRRSVAQLSEFQRRNPAARMIPTHDPDEWGASAGKPSTSGTASAGSPSGGSGA